MNLSMKHKQTHIHRDQTCSCQEGDEWRGNRLSVELTGASYYIENG